MTLTAIGYIDNTLNYSGKTANSKKQLIKLLNFLVCKLHRSSWREVNSLPTDKNQYKRTEYASEAE